jgi:lipid A 3-O-deacylase
LAKRTALINLPQSGVVETSIMRQRASAEGGARCLVAAAMTVAAGWAGHAAAQTVAAPAISPPSVPSSSAPFWFIDEIKGGVLAHDITFSTSSVESGVDVNVEALFTPLFTPVDIWGIGVSLRPHLGVAVNTAGDTSKAYAGLTISFTLCRDLFQPGDAIFLDGGFGLAVHDGYLDGGPSDRKDLGSRVLGHRAGEIGYRFTPQVSVAAYVDHVGNYGFATPNSGLKTAGIRFGFKF